MKAKIFAILIIAVLMTGGLVFMSCAPTCSWGGSCEITATSNSGVGYTGKMCGSSKCKVVTEFSKDTPALTKDGDCDCK
ncbi:MAG: hypothetical protein FWC19_07650 [Treponema sp.]|nr:hypothetical protein [Treponema sp.]MCL2272655.1 hypothetical protein [Treponema sp.]